jgi:hypothetical protein
MANTSKPNYVYTPEIEWQVDQFFDIVDPEAAFATPGEPVDTDFEDFGARRWPDDECDV